MKKLDKNSIVYSDNGQPSSWMFEKQESKNQIRVDFSGWEVYAVWVNHRDGGGWYSYWSAPANNDQGDYAHGLEVEQSRNGIKGADWETDSYICVK